MVNRVTWWNIARMGAVVLSIGISTAGVTIPLLTSYVLEVSKVAAAKVWFDVSLIQAGVSVALTAVAGLNGELIPSDVVNLAASLVMVVISAIHLHHTIQFSNTQKMLLTSVDENANIIIDTDVKNVQVNGYTDEYIDLVKPERSKAYFWSGTTDGIGGEVRALQIAQQNGGTTLENMVDKKGIIMPTWDSSNPATVQVWKNLSAAYASQCSGEVHAVIGSTLRPDNVWENIESPILISNPNVTKIIKIDPKTLVETVLFSR